MEGHKFHKWIKETAKKLSAIDGEIANGGDLSSYEEDLFRLYQLYEFSEKNFT